MGKQGPCYHCGVTSTPLWRNGPPDKPVLCNACGSRWRTKGTLLNYTPLHARADPADYEDDRVARAKTISINKSKEVKLLKRKYAIDNVVGNGGIPLDYNSVSPKFLEEDMMSNRSSSGSAMSYSDLQPESADASDLTGPAQSVVWDSTFPSKKRTFMNRKQSSVEKLTQELHAIMHEQQNSCLSMSSEEDLLFESMTPMSSFEIGHGTVILRDPSSSVAQEEESEASSLSFDRKQYKPTNILPHRGGRKGVDIPSPSPRMVKIKRPIEQLELKRDILQQQILGNHNSASRKDVIKVDEYMKHLTKEEEQQHLKCLPSAEIARLPESLRSLFDSSENLPAVPQLSGAKFEDCKAVKKLTVTSLMKLKEAESNHSPEESKNSSKSSSVGLSTLLATASSNILGGKRPRDVQNQSFSEAVMTITSPKRHVTKGILGENKEFMDGEGACFSPRSLFAFPSDGSSLMLDSSPFVDENSDHGLLLHVPSNSSFMQAELLCPASTSSSSLKLNLLHPR